MADNLSVASKHRDGDDGRIVNERCVMNDEPINEGAIEIAA